MEVDVGTTAVDDVESDVIDVDVDGMDEAGDVDVFDVEGRATSAVDDGVTTRT